MNKQCPVVKNEFYELEIVSLGANGEGIGRKDGYTLFVRGAIPGDLIKMKVIKVKKKYGIGIIDTILSPSLDRVEPLCPIANKCGGCNIQHMSYEAQLKYKENLIAESLVRIGGLDDADIRSKLEPIIGASEPYYYRNKVQYPVRDNHGGIEIGFYAKGSHRIVETPRCYIQDVYNEEIVKTVRSFMMEHHVPAYNEELQKGLIRHIVIRKSHEKDVFHVTIVINGRKLPKVEILTNELMDLDKVEAVSLNINMENTNVVLGSTIINMAGPEYLEDNIKEIKYHISQKSFYQVNPQQTVKLYEKALEYAALTGNETVYDLYCGIGTISLFLAKQAKEVYGVEVVEEAILDAKENAKLNEIENVHFYVGKAEEVMPRLFKEKEITADVVVVDPPRKGCEESLLDAIIQMGVSKMIYVSCDPGTLARDVKYLVANGYYLDKICGVDMFSHSVHVETVVRISKIDS